MKSFQNHKNKYVITCFSLLCFQTVFSQWVDISGKVESKTNVENIHVINKTSQLFTITSTYGNFNIGVKLNDTLTFSSVQHKLKEIIISREIILAKALFVKLEEQINELDEVTVGNVLTGDLNLDVNNTEGDPPINFFDLGIPGYQGKPATQTERRLSEAGEFHPKMLLGLLGGSVPLNPIINGISGRTKMLKEHVKLEKNDELLRKIKANLSEDFFSMNTLDEHLRIDFFYFCQEDLNFRERCRGKRDLEILEFLKEKLIAYKANIKLNKD